MRSTGVVLRSEAGSRSRRESEGAREKKRRERPRSRENENARKGIVTGVTKGLGRRDTNGERKKSDLLHRKGSLISLSPTPGEGYVQVREEFLCARLRV